MPVLSNHNGFFIKALSSGRESNVSTIKNDCLINQNRFPFISSWEAISNKDTVAVIIAVPPCSQKALVKLAIEMISMYYAKSFYCKLSRIRRIRSTIQEK